MGIQNQAALDSANAAFYELFDEIFEGSPPGPWREFCELRSTDAKINEVDILEAMPAVREWVGSKLFPDMKASTLSSTIKTYERSFAIKRLDLETNNSGQIARRIAAFLRDAGQIYDKLATDALLANGTGYDGVSLFSASHPRGPAGATQSNITTSALSFATYESALISMQSLRDANGEPMGINPNVMICGPKTRKDALEITNSRDRLKAVDASGAESGTRVAAAAVDNVFAGGEMLVYVSPRLVGSYDDHVYLLDTTKPGVSPIVGFEKRAPEGISQTDMDGEGRFMLDELRYSVECDASFAPGAWQVAHGFIL
jgi:phage major head subunit gpT-like protein